MQLSSAARAFGAWLGLAEPSARLRYMMPMEAPGYGVAHLSPPVKPTGAGTAQGTLTDTSERDWARLAPSKGKSGHGLKTGCSGLLR